MSFGKRVGFSPQWPSKGCVWATDGTKIDGFLAQGIAKAFSQWQNRTIPLGKQYYEQPL